MYSNSFNILVIEDDPDLGAMMKLMLEIRKYKVTLVQDADQDIKSLLIGNNIQLLITDMLLAGIHGSDICRALKSDPLTQHIPVMIVSAHPNAAEITMQSGADGFLAKPFDMNEFLDKVAGFEKVKISN